MNKNEIFQSREMLILSHVLLGSLRFERESPDRQIPVYVNKTAISHFLNTSIYNMHWLGPVKDN